MKLAVKSNFHEVNGLDSGTRMNRVNEKKNGKLDLNEETMIFLISIITQVIIEILVISLVEDYIISCYNHLTRGDYSGSTNFQTAAWRFVDVSEEEI